MLLFFVPSTVAVCVLAHALGSPLNMGFNKVMPAYLVILYDISEVHVGLCSKLLQSYMTS